MALKLLRPTFRRKYLKRNAKIYCSAKIIADDCLVVGEFVYVGPNCFFNAEGGITIGDGTIIAPEVVILSSSHDYKTGRLMPYDIYDEHRNVKIGRGVWIGYRAMICPGVTIGDGAVIAMGAVVSKPVGDGEIVGGNPAVLISTRKNEEYRELLERQEYFHRVYWKGKRPKIPVAR